MDRVAARERSSRSDARVCGLCGCGFTSIHVEVIGGVEIYACESCLRSAARNNYIWLCLQCRRAYLKPKKLVVEQIGDVELREYYLRGMNEQLVQGIDRCSACESAETVPAPPAPWAAST